jgi:hypothetical protein
VVLWAATVRSKFVRARARASFERLTAVGHADRHTATVVCGRRRIRLSEFSSRHPVGQGRDHASRCLAKKPGAEECEGALGHPAGPDAVDVTLDGLLNRPHHFADRRLCVISF